MNKERIYVRVLNSAGTVNTIGINPSYIKTIIKDSKSSGSIIVTESCTIKVLDEYEKLNTEYIKHL